MTTKSLFDACRILASASLHATDPTAKETLLEATLHLGRELNALYAELEFQRKHTQIMPGIYLPKDGGKPVYRS